MIIQTDGAHTGHSRSSDETIDLKDAIFTDPRTGPNPTLPEFDVRLQLDDAVKRGWAEIGRRVVRLGFLLVIDTLAASVAIVASLLVSRVLNDPIGGVTSSDIAATTILLLLQPLSLGICGAYGMGAKRLEGGRIAQAVALAVVLSWMYSLLPSALAIGLGSVGFLVYLAFAGVAIVCGRFAFDRLLAAAYSRGIGQRKVLIVGSAHEAAMVDGLLCAQRGCDVRVVGRLSSNNIGDSGSIGNVADLETVLKSTGARGIILASNLSFEAFDTVVRRCFEAGVIVSVVPRSLHQYGTRLEIRRARKSALLELYPQGLRLPQLALKRLMDLTITVTTLAVIWPLMALIAVAIKLDSRGPIFFKQRRAGRGGRPFFMYKFRTMVSDADRLKAALQHLNESGDPRLFKIKRDPRVTRIGRWLRRTSLDELPQLFNVLRGEMSLVGPRPFFPDDLRSYEAHHFERLSVLPGITGLWQVSGRSDIMDFEEVVRIDTAYIRNWSIGRDMAILARTLPAAFGRGGAY